MPNLRLASADASSDRAGLSAALAAMSPDVAVVHGAPHLARWRSLSAQLARTAGLVVVGGGRVGGANLVMSSLAVDFVAVSDTLFSRNPARPTGVCVARLRRNGAEFAVAGASLGVANAATDAAALRYELAQAGDLSLVLSIVGASQHVADLGKVLEDRLVVSSAIDVASVESRGQLVVADLVLPD